MGGPETDCSGRWREAQARRRRARLSRRGLATLCVLAFTPVALWAWGGSLPEASEEGADADAAPVGVPRVDAPPPPAPPAELLARLPAGREVLELGAVLPDGSLSGPVSDESVSGRVFERVDAPGRGTLRIEYTFDAELTRRVFETLRRARVALGHVILMDPRSGRVLAYASTDPEGFPATRAYPAASLVKVVTAAAALDANPELARLPCRFTGSPYRLTPRRIDPPRRGNEVSLRKALATSNNQCFAQLAVHAVGAGVLLDAITDFGWLDAPAPAHEPGSADPGDDRYDVGRLGCGLAGSRITPLHAAQLAATLAEGEVVAPHWIDRIVDERERELPLPARSATRRVLSFEVAEELREMLVDTTTRGTARKAFRGRGGRPLLGPVRVAGKTGSLTGSDPHGRYEWFTGAAPADHPRIAVAVLVVQGDLYWRTASQVAAEVLGHVFCEGRDCDAHRAERWLGGALVAGHR